MHTPAHKLYILGFSPSTIPIIVETFYTSKGIKAYEILENMDQIEPQKPYLPDYLQLTKSQYTNQEIDSSQYIHLGVSGIIPKKKVMQFFLEKAGLLPEQYTTIVHPTASVFQSVSIGAGSLLEQLTCISSFSVIGLAVSVKRGTTIGHHCTIGDFVNLNPGVTICGNVTIGQGTIIGAGATIIDGISIGQNCIIGAGSVVVKSIPDNVVAFGNPCVVKRLHN